MASTTLFVVMSIYFTASTYRRLVLATLGRERIMDVVAMTAIGVSPCGGNSVRRGTVHTVRWVVLR